MGQNEKSCFWQSWQTPESGLKRGPAFGLLNENESAFAWDFLKRGAAAGTSMFWGGYGKQSESCWGFSRLFGAGSEFISPYAADFFYRRRRPYTQDFWEL